MTASLQDEIVSAAFPEGFVGNAVELGAGDGILLSTTLWMERRGWSVLCIEPNVDLFPELARNRKHVIRVACADYDKEQDDFYVMPIPAKTHHGVYAALKPPSERFRATFTHAPLAGELRTTKTVTLDSAIASCGFNSVDFVSVDVDGLEMSVLRGLNIDKWLPRALLVENPFDDKEMSEYFKYHGYNRTHRLLEGTNDLFVLSV